MATAFIPARARVVRGVRDVRAVAVVRAVGVVRGCRGGFGGRGFQFAFCSGFFDPPFFPGFGLAFRPRFAFPCGLGFFPFPLCFPFQHPRSGRGHGRDFGLRPTATRADRSRNRHAQRHEKSPFRPNLLELRRHGRTLCGTHQFCPVGLEGGSLKKLSEAIGRRRGIARGALLWVEAAAAVATVAAIGIGVVNHFTSTGDAKLAGEGKRVVAFRQVANRICTENQDNLHRALAEGRSRVERLGFVARAVGWDVNDLESITPPPTRFDAFLAEIAVRKQVRPQILALQRSIELGDQSQEASAIAALEALEAESRELSRESGTVRCVRILPPIRGLIG